MSDVSPCILKLLIDWSNAKDAVEKSCRDNPNSDGHGGRHLVARVAITQQALWMAARELAVDSAAGADSAPPSR